MQRKPFNLVVLAAVVAALGAGAGCDKLRARDKLNKGVQAFRGGQFEAAVEDFKQAKDLDPQLLNARLYLATAYANQYIPGAPSPENIRMGNQAIQEFQQVLDKDPNNLPAIDGIGSILYNMAGGPPLDLKKMEDSKAYHEKHIQIKPEDPEPYYWIGVIDWSIAFRGNKDMREDYNKTSKKPLKDTDPMPPALAKQFSDKFGSDISEGMDNLKKAIERKPDYDDAMAYLNLMYRQKADLEPDPSARSADLKAANDWLAKAMEARKAGSAQPSATP
jgi:tetratricopeptide (TPR) repeat protein